MIERKPILDDLAGKVIDALSEMSRGDVIGHGRIEELTGIPKDGAMWKTVVLKVKRRLLDERGIELWPVQDVGYRLSTVEQQMHDNVKARLRRSRRQASKARAALESLPIRELGIHEQQLRSARIDAVKHLQKVALSKTRSIGALCKVAEVLPR